MTRKRIWTRVRGAVNSALLNPVFVRFYDRFWPSRSLGAAGERFAERYLLRRGLIIVARGYSDHFGEIDLIAVDDNTVVFVEVKTRLSDDAGKPAEAVDLQKQQKITQTAISYLHHHDLLECRVRFDVISIVWRETAQTPQLEHFENAFESA